jgi:hypothetical protein
VFVLACLFMVVLYKSEQFDISSTDISSRVIFSTMAVVNECGIILKVGLDSRLNYCIGDVYKHMNVDLCL